MAHSVPKQLKGDERIFTIPIVNLHFNKKGTVYAGIAVGISVVIKKLTNIWVFIPTLIILNMIAYPLAHFKKAKNKFEGGNLTYDIYLARKFKFKYLKRIRYIRGSEDR